MMETNQPLSNYDHHLNLQHPRIFFLIIATSAKRSEKKFVEKSRFHIKYLINRATEESDDRDVHCQKFPVKVFCVFNTESYQA